MSLPDRAGGARGGERRLVRRAGRGDAEAFGALYDLYADRVYGYCKARVGDHHDAEDLTEAVFLQAYEAIGTYSDRGLPFGAWLFRIAHNAVVDALRRRARRPYETAAELPECGDAVPDPEDSVLRAAEADRVRACVARLTDEQAAVVTLRHLWGFDVSETARVLGKTEGAVKALQHRALRALAGMLRQEPEPVREGVADAV
ncbi:MAG: sigma-70 family RNA polymerase sigma factor [Coriobacteriia bacterium]|nr:sigma-70 family RNA polymerase sigma factor [Coriobacteriia bacterium]